jgi:hypothetical protein
MVNLAISIHAQNQVYTPTLINQLLINLGKRAGHKLTIDLLINLRMQRHSNCWLITAKPTCWG